MFEYQGFATLGVNLNRQKYGPLDISSIFTSEADLKYYVSKGSFTEGVTDYWKNTVPYPYAGQFVALINNDTRAVETYVLKEREDGTFDYDEIGAKAPEVDGSTIIINRDGKLEAVIPEFTDTNTVYTLTMESVENGTKLVLTPSEGEAQEIVLPKVDLSDYLTTADKTNLENAIATKANAADVYTKTETEGKIAEAVAAADHLQRKVVTSVDDIKPEEDGADKYIYMVPSGLEDDDNKYYEYIVIDGVVEKVGNWAVDLSDYVKTTTLEANYLDKATATSTYLSKADASSTYETSEHAEATYAKATEVEATYAKADAVTNLENALNEKVDAVAGSSLMTSEEKAKLEGIAAGAEVNFVKSVDQTKFNVTEEGLLQLLSLKTSDVTGLDSKIGDIESAIATKVDKKDGFDLISSADQAKLNKLTLTDGDLTISGSVEAGSVTNLDTWITSHRETVAGLFSTDDEKLLDEVNTKVTNVENLLNNYVTTETHNNDIKAVKDMFLWTIMDEGTDE